MSQQERLEEMSGYSPSTIAAPIFAADFARQRSDWDTAVFLEQFAGWIERNLEAWTVPHVGSLVEGVTNHYVRVNPAKAEDYLPEGGVRMRLSLS